MSSQSAPDAELAARYVAGTATTVESLRVEDAMASSAAWRGLVGSQIDPGRLELGLDLIHVELDAPRRGVVERLMVRLGLPEHVARLMAATPVLRRSWYLASFLVLFFGVVASGDDRTAPTVAYFLALAPVIPVLGVGLAYGPGIDPAQEMTTVTPLSGFRLLLLRSITVLGTSVAFGGLASLLLASRDGLRVVGWMLPALALTATSLALAAFLPTRIAAAVTGGGWLIVVAAVAQGGDELALFGGRAQPFYLALAALAGAVLVLRRGQFESAEVAP